MTLCIFCAILAGNAPAIFIQRGELVSAFMDIMPVNPGHLLVVPNQHAASLAELDPGTGAEMFRLAQKLAGALRRSGLPCAGVNLYLADGTAAGQEVFHLHLHVIPRNPGDGAGMRRGSYGHTRASDLAIEATAAALLRAIEP